MQEVPLIEYVRSRSPISPWLAGNTLECTGAEGEDPACSEPYTPLKPCPWGVPAGTEVEGSLQVPRAAKVTGLSLRGIA